MAIVMDMEKWNFGGVMFTRETGKKVKKMDLVPINTQMALSYQGTGKQDYKMEKVL